MNLNEIKEALSKALPGKWERTGEGWMNVPNCANIVVKDEWGQTYVAQTYAGNHQEANAHLIANAPQWLASLIEHYEECRDDALILAKQVEEMQKIIETAVMFLQSNELHIKAAQIKAMVQSLKEEQI